MGRRARSPHQGMEGDMTQIDHAVSEYLSELEAEAELARDDLAELEDHMRSLVEELRATGASTEHAIAQAKLRLGDPRTIAREHTRVRSPFGAKLSRARAFSGGGLFLALVVLNFVLFAGRSPFVGYFVIETLIGVGLAGALMARFAWARAAVAAFVTYGLLQIGVGAMVHGGLRGFEAPTYLMLAIQLGVLAFVAPWRRGEIGPAGYALALVVVMYAGASWVINFEIWNPVLSPEAVVAHVAQFATIFAGIGIVMRARWAAVMAAVSTTSLAVAAAMVFEIGLPPGAEEVRYLMTGTVIAGAVAALACTRLSWRVARTGLGTLRGFTS